MARKAVRAPCLNGAVVPLQDTWRRGAKTGLVLKYLFLELALDDLTRAATLAL